MRAKEFITEISKPLESDVRIVSLIRQNCAPYLQEIGGLYNALIKFPMYRGLSKFDWDKTKDPIKLLTVNMNRTPRDMDGSTHDDLNDWFEAKTGVRYRSEALFCSGDYSIAEQYATDFRSHNDGDVVIILPIGKYEYAWSTKIEDLYTYLDPEESWESSEDANSVMSKLGYVNNTNLTGAIYSGHEIMVHCKQAYAISFVWARYLATMYK